MASSTESTHDTRSLANVHSSVGTSQLSFWRRMFAFAGPAYLVSVGYMDPGNWATDLEGGARFGYRLLWVLVMSNGMAILLQTLAARLGIVSGRDLAQACRETYPRPVTLALWVLCEIAIAACDLAEVLGAAIALNMLFHIPLLVGRAAHRRRYAAAAGVSELRHPHHRSLHSGADRGDRGLLLHRGFLGQAGLDRKCSTGLAPRLNSNTPLPGRRHSGRHRDAAQSVPAFGAGADAHHRARRGVQARRLPVQPDRFGGGAQRRHVRQLRHPGAGGGGILHGTASWSRRFSRRSNCWCRCFPPLSPG